MVGVGVNNKMGKWGFAYISFSLLREWWASIHKV
jgi:hypothetical protein